MGDNKHIIGANTRDPEIVDLERRARAAFGNPAVDLSPFLFSDPAGVLELKQALDERDRKKIITAAGMIPDA